MSSFLQKIQQSRNGDVVLLFASDAEDLPCYFYLRVDPLKKSIFERQITQGRINIAEFGTVLESGYGFSVPPDIAARMKDEYGFEE